MLLPIADYAPDLPANNAAGMSNSIVNLYPKTTESWAPVNSLSSYSTNAMDGQCIGACTAPDSAGNNYTFLGTGASLYELIPGSTALSRINTGFTVPIGEHWNFTQFGQRIVAVAQGQAPQSFILGTSSAFANLSASAPQARYCAVIRDWLFFANTTDPTFGAQPQRVWWSAIDDPTSWPTPGSTTAAQLLSDYQDIPGDQGWCQGIVGNLGTSDGAVFFERAIWRVVYSGSPTIFSFYPCEGVRGTPAPKSIAQLGAVVFYLGEDGFYAFDGSTSKPIGVNRIDKTFYASVNPSYMHNVVAAVDPINKLVLWQYPSLNSSTGAPDSILIYNWALDKWGASSQAVEYIFRALSQGYSLEGLDAVVTPANLDALPFSLDSRVWTGGNIIVGAIDGNHKLNYFTGAPLNASADTVELEIYPQTELYIRQNLAGRRAFVYNARPLVDGGTPSVQIGTRARLQDAAVFSAASSVNTNGDCPVRADGRFVRARLSMTSGFSHLQGCAIDVRPSGSK